MRLLIVTGMSGAGRTTALKMLEDMDYFCVDNLPIPLLTRFMELVVDPKFVKKKAAIGVDIRNGQDLPSLQEVLEQLPEGMQQPEILFLDAGEACLVKRYKETRRRMASARSAAVWNFSGRRQIIMWIPPTF